MKIHKDKHKEADNAGNIKVGEIKHLNRVKQSKSCLSCLKHFIFETPDLKHEFQVKAMGQKYCINDKRKD